MGYVALVPSFGLSEEAGVSQPLLMFSPCLGIPENVGVTQKFNLFWAPEKAGVR